jgi:RNA:NAD 2'-phosphotransferase (TPT1/KptA family)
VRELSKYGAKLLRAEAWTREIAEMEQGWAEVAHGAEGVAQDYATADLGDDCQ